MKVHGPVGRFAIIESSQELSFGRELLDRAVITGDEDVAARIDEYSVRGIEFTRVKAVLAPIVLKLARLVVDIYARIVDIDDEQSLLPVELHAMSPQQHSRTSALI